MITTQILSQKILGYGKDYKETYIQYEVILANGETKIVYSTNTQTEFGLHIGTVTTQEPFVELPLDTASKIE